MATIVLQNLTGRVLVRLRRLARLHYRSVTEEAGVVLIAQLRRLPAPLIDFSVYYTQGAAEAAIAAMKEGKSDVLCESGHLYKVSKNKDGAVKRERLTNHWTDWVDYWATDFDYMSRKEIIKVPRGMGIDIFGNDTMTLVPVNVG